MKKLLIFLTTASLFSSAVFGAVVSGKDEESAATRHDKIYHFEHRLLPGWVHNTEGHFFADLASGIPEPMIDAAKEVDGAEFVKSLKLKSYPAEKAYVIVFQQPAQASECYYAIIKKEAKGYSYYILERGVDLFGVGGDSFVCMWTKDLVHTNLGVREYNDLDSFIKEVIFGDSDS
ncbi:MAG: hypothetical protein ABFR47_02780 [Verrucomicrobiota bacterium]